MSLGPQPHKESEESVTDKPERFRKAGPQSPPWPGEEAQPSGHLGNRKHEPRPTAPPGEPSGGPGDTCPFSAAGTAGPGHGAHAGGTVMAGPTGTGSPPGFRGEQVRRAPRWPSAGGGCRRHWPEAHPGRRGAFSVARAAGQGRDSGAASRPVGEEPGALSWGRRAQRKRFRGGRGAGRVESVGEPGRAAGGRVRAAVQERGAASPAPRSPQSRRRQSPSLRALSFPPLGSPAKVSLAAPRIQAG